MAQMIFQAIPGFVDIPDANIAAHAVVTEDVLVKLLQNAKFACVRPEFIFMGYYKNGDTVPQPISPVDQYVYSRQEITYDCQVFTTRGPNTDFVTGQATLPSQAILQPANIYWLSADVDDATGQVVTIVSYFKVGGAETITHDALVQVIAICQRQSVNPAS